MIRNADIGHYKFQSTPLMRGETSSSGCEGLARIRFQSTPLMRGETPVRRSLQQRSRIISIHSPHARGDRTGHSPGGTGHFNPLPSCEGRHQLSSTWSVRSPHFNPLPSCEGRLFTGSHADFKARYEFQSTPLMRGETAVTIIGAIDPRHHFNPLPSCEGRPIASRAPSRRLQNFNPLPSCEGRRKLMSNDMTDFRNFNPLPSCEGRPCCEDHVATAIRHFNPLPSCEGRPRYKSVCSRRLLHYFNPLPSCEGRRFASVVIDVMIYAFQSTPLMRGETSMSIDELVNVELFQSTPLMRGETMSSMCVSPPARYFNPLPSCEGRQHKPPKIRLDSRQFIQQKHHSSFF